MPLFHALGLSGLLNATVVAALLRIRGAAMAADLMDQFESKFGLLILEMYGLTESRPHAT